MHERITVNRETIRHWLIYQPANGVFRWRKSPNGFAARLSVAGSKPKIDGYIYIGLKHKVYKAHRLAFFLIHDSWPEEVDHADNIRHNNAARNLRGSTRYLNQHNSLKRKDNTSGTKGISWATNVGKYRARIQTFGERIDVGYFDSIESAREAINKMRQTLHGEFFNNGEKDN